MSLEPESPVVLITGASGGLGRVLVESFRADGWRVAAAGHTRRPVGEGEDFLASRVDVTDGVAVRAWVAEIVRRWGRIDLLVNNAGVVRDAPLARLGDADWNEVLGVNLKGPFLCAQAVLPSMMAQGTGRVLNVASFAGRAGARGQSNYSAAKAGLIGLTLSLARELGTAGIQVNAVLPGVLATAMTAAVDAKVMEAFAAANALGRINDTASVARAIVAIARMPDVSGQIFQLDSRVGRWV